jgi:hypothetical protein
MADATTGAAAAALAGTDPGTTQTTTTPAATQTATAGEPHGQGTSQAPDWAKGWAPEDVGYIEKKGFKQVDDLYKAYRNAERAISQDKIVLPKDDADPKEWDAVFNRLGRPESADKYTIPEGADEAMFKALAPKLHESGLSNKQVERITAGYNEYVEGIIAGQEKAYLEDQSKAMAKLEAEWGAKGPQEIEFNRRAARAIGLSVDDAKRYMQGGAERFMRLLNLAGRAIAEDSAGDIRDDATLGFGLNPNRAAAELTELRNDKEFMARYTRGEPGAKAKYDRLLKAADEGGKVRRTINTAYR